MVGSLVQLYAQGPQNAFLTERFQPGGTSLFRHVYKRATNFALENVRLNFLEAVDFGKTLTVNIPQSRGDMWTHAYLRVVLPALTPASGTYAGYTNSVGYALINQISLEIGGSVISTLTGLSLEIDNELSLRQYDNTNGLIGKYIDPVTTHTDASTQREYFIPLRWWFTKSLGASLPLVALEGHRIRVILEMNSFANVIVYDGNTPPSTPTLVDASLEIGYAYLENSEREWMKCQEHTYLIDQLQWISEGIPAGYTAHQTPLAFNHPVNQLYFVFVDTNAAANNDWFNFSVYNSNPVSPFLVQARLLLDGRQREDYLDESYLRLVNSYKWYSNTLDKFIYVMPFSGSPEMATDYPSGSLNMSMFDNVALDLQLNSSNPSCTLYVLAKNFNFLVVKNQMGALMFAY